MIATDRMLFLHLHKSAGTFVNAMLMRCVPSARQIGYHLPYREVPPQFADLPVVGTVRNPWAFYVSWYHFQATRSKPNILFKLCSDGGQLSFEQSAANLATLASNEQLLTALEAALPANFAKAGLNLVKADVGDLRDSGLGFYSFLFERLFAGASEPTILRAEHIRHELPILLQRFGHLPNDCIELYLQNSPKLNVSQHGDVGSYYSPALSLLVGERDRTVIERFRYEP